MSIAFSCPDCEKTFKVPDAMAGRKAKCSGCGATILIKNVIGLTEKPTAKIRSKAALVEDEDDYQEEDAAPRKRRGHRDDVDDVDDDLDNADEEPTRKSKKKGGKSKKKKKSRAMLLALVGFLVLGLCGAGSLGGVALWYFWPASTESLKYAPDNCKIVAIVNIEQIENSKAYETIAKESSNFKKDFGDPLKSEAMTKAGVSQVMFAGGGSISWNGMGGPGADDQTVIVVKTKSSIDAKDILADKNNKGPYKESTVNGYTLYEGPSDAFCVPDKKHVVAGKADTLRKILQRDKKPEFSDNMKAAMKRVDFSKSVAVALDSEGSTANSPTAKDLAPMELQWAALEANCKTDIEVTITVQSKSENGAKEIKKKADELVKLVKSLKDMGAAFGAKQPDLFDEPKLAVSGSTFTAEITFKADAIAQSSKNQQNFNFFNPPGGNPPGGFPPGGVPPGGIPPGGNPPPKKK
jgi:DNA-directed RNA polymerase subunit RPC12/RpoP